jgi:hypothetical protein
MFDDRRGPVARSPGRFRKVGRWACRSASWCRRKSGSCCSAALTGAQASQVDQCLGEDIAVAARASTSSWRQRALLTALHRGLFGPAFPDPCMAEFHSTLMTLRWRFKPWGCRPGGEAKGAYLQSCKPVLDGNEGRCGAFEGRQVACVEDYDQARLRHQPVRQAMPVARARAVVFAHGDQRRTLNAVRVAFWSGRSRRASDWRRSTSGPSATAMSRQRSKRAVSEGSAI